MTYGVNAPLGLVPTSYFIGAPYTGAFQQIPLPANYGTSLYTGDLVKYANGNLNIYTPGGTTGTAGVFIGCTYTDNSGIVQFSKYWPSAQSIKSGTTAIANVITDVNTVFSIQANGIMTTTNVDQNADVSFAITGNPATGLSGMVLDTASIANTGTLPLRIIGFAPIPGNVSGINYANALVVINQSAFKAGTTGV